MNFDPLQYVALSSVQGLVPSSDSAGKSFQPTAFHQNLCRAEIRVRVAELKRIEKKGF